MNQKTVDKFHIEYEQERIWEKTFWLGLPFWKLPSDGIIIQEIIFELQPDYIIETGTAFGGSALFYASIMKLIGKGKVITVDREKRSIYDNPIAEKIKDELILEIIGNSIDSKVVSYIAETVKNKKNMVILDSWHSKEHVLAELELYNNFVPCGSYLIVEDTHVNNHPVPWKWGEGPYEAIEEFLIKHNDFEIDGDCEKLFCTFNPNGFLRRKW